MSDNILDAEVEGQEMRIEFSDVKSKVDLNERIKRIRLKGKDGSYSKKSSNY